MLCRKDFVCYLKIVTSPSETISFPWNLGSLYNTFGIHSKGMKPDGVSLKQAKRILQRSTTI